MLTEGQTEQFHITKEYDDYTSFHNEKQWTESRKEHTNKLRHIFKYAAFNAIQRLATLAMLWQQATAIRETVKAFGIDYSVTESRQTNNATNG